MLNWDSLADLIDDEKIRQNDAFLPNPFEK